MKKFLDKRLVIVALLLFIVFGGIFLGRYLIIKLFVMPKMTQKPLPTPVSVVEVKSQSWHPSISVPGTLVAVNGIELSPEVSGVVSAIYFHSGDSVKKGQLLVQLDDAVDRQELKSLQAEMDLNRSNYQRLKRLIHSQAVSKQDLETAESAYHQSHALVSKQEHIIDQKAIRAPFAGRVGIREVNVGQYVAPGTEMVSLQSMDPLLVRFNVPEAQLSSIHVNQVMKVSMKGDHAQQFNGKVSAIGSKINEETRNIQVEGVVPNPNQALIPGGFVQVDLMLPVKKNVLTLPQTSISFTLYGDSVLLLTKTPDKVSDGGQQTDLQNADKTEKDSKPVYTVSHVMIDVGERDDDKVAVTHGLKAGDVVINGGQLRVQPGAQVVIKEPESENKKNSAS